MKRLLLAPLILGLGLPVHADPVSNARIENLTSGSLETICGAHDLNYISDKNTESMLEIIYNSHMKTYKGSLDDANASFRKIYSETLEEYPVCNSRAFRLKRN